MKVKIDIDYILSRKVMFSLRFIKFCEDNVGVVFNTGGNSNVIIVDDWSFVVGFDAIEVVDEFSIEDIINNIYKGV